MKYLRGSARAASLGVVVLAATLALGGCASDDVEPVEAQNPMGDNATADAADRDGMPDPEETANGNGHAYRFGSSAAESARCLTALQERITSAAAAQRGDSTAKSPGAGRDPARAERHGWYPEMPAFRDGSILPCARIVAYYGHPSSARMGVLGEYPKDEMLERLREQVDAWREADPATPVVPALHMVSVVAQGEPGSTGTYRTISSDEKVTQVYEWAKEAGGIFIVDIQAGQDDIRNILPRFEWILQNPDVHLAIDPEFYMRDGVVPGRKIGTMYASDINYASEYLAGLVEKYDLPPKVLVVHRFTRPMIRDYRDVRLRPEVQIVVNMDGWGAPWLKFDSFADYIVQEPIQFAGWKNFYHNDTKNGDPLLLPLDLLRLHPVPLYVQYQ